MIRPAAEENASNMVVVKAPQDGQTGGARRREHNIVGSIDGDTQTNPQEQITYGVTTRNRYAPIQEVQSEPDDIEMDAVEETTAAPPKISQKKAIPPPPIHLHDIHEHRQLVNIIKAVTNSQFNIKYTRDAAIVQVATEPDRQAVMDKFRVCKFNFHTFTDKNIRTNAYVIYGLTEQTTENEIIEQLQSLYGIAAIKCARMKTNKYPTYMFTVSAEVKPEAIYKIKGIDSTSVTTAKYMASKRITQCYNCQMWGHATANCFATAKCLKCAGAHDTRSCVKPKEEPATCANCHQPHPANATICPLFIRRKEFLDRRVEERRNTQRQPQTTQTQRTFAPAPATSPWTEAGRAARGIRSPAAPTTVTQNAPITPAPAGVDAFTDLQAEMATLHQLIDIKEVVSQIRKLNGLLQGAATAQQRMLIAVKFFAGFNV